MRYFIFLTFYLCYSFNAFSESCKTTDKVSVIFLNGVNVNEKQADDSTRAIIDVIKRKGKVLATVDQEDICYQTVMAQKQ